MKEQFQDINISADRLALIATINQILAEYEAQGYDLSVRQAYYQLVARNIVPNTEKSYKRVCEVISDGRLAGLIDWDMIKDRGRECIRPVHWNSPADIVDAAASQFRIDKWAEQPHHVEVMVEKQALEGVLVPVCKELDIPFSANKGYSSSSAMYEAGQRLADADGNGKDCHVIYLGDHDPSGIDMTRDIDERLCMFARCHVHVVRLALNMDQVEHYDPPENPAKLSDSRAQGYIERFGTSSWELDALAPDVLANLVRDAVANLRDDDLWNEAVAREAEMRGALAKMAAEYRQQ